MTMQPWFPDAKFGIFIHWGIYAVDGVQESWSFFEGDVPHDQYMAQLDGFTAARYNPREWAELFARAGARYAVLTSRHHDGVSLWDTALGDLDVVRHTPAGRDLVGPYTEALRKQGLKVGLYYSHSDWNHPDYASTRYEGRPVEQENNPYAEVPEEQEDLTAWARYLDYRDGQVRELATRFRPDLLWFDGEWERTEEQWRIRELAALIRSELPACVLNARMLSEGDYATPEQGVPIEAPEGPWELCLTLNDSWGYRHHDHHYKSTGQLIRYFTETIGAGGNLLLSVGPKADGTLPAEQVERLEGMGAWIARHSDAVYGTVAGLPPGHHYGPSTLSADGRTLYLTVFDIPRGPVGVRGLRTPVRRVSVLGTGAELGHTVLGGLHEVPGVLWIDPPEAADLDEHATVLAVELDGELDLYRGAGRL
ncbi:alpha-L-fucosidase [Streptomyces scopuliridis]|uniref:Alpha-L-fucosidase n=1 Tax=Streptomyces scopuliridis TaxID=452529 RepID=A0ACD4ZVZ3_9ACTN|nr:alpha-L-fucosidase [Streptomyces scopuliridis]WSB38218.1 alpha-L-fucosidase [Streptomyces scopuliridis]WSC02651.1 alpha-L-fucosidase [Streptomyces scopuliridis]WSC03817.1 alpha-L-fucosidase [Streptomyces scopuliridis]